MPGLPEARVEESLAFLQKTSSKNGQSVFDHFVEVVQQVGVTKSLLSACSALRKQGVQALFL